ncbi:hypothetical protein LTR37_017057 [Vermiconidia calcicola]|uniref:Uncharacterized protein n=1 Tax=Vermiconidia calcicola TaxID=1690605 RepID=A0ACC3MLW4_9PEZI|nr:hypothetical protein LTR37_017057 [Vermiconidia calcicola]
MREIAEQLVQHRRGNPTEKRDLLSAKVNGKDPKTGELMPDAPIAANMITSLVAGHETTSGLLSFAMLNLRRNLETYSKAQQEVDKVTGRRKMAVEHMKSLIYINAVLRETLRLMPTIPAFSRSIRNDNPNNVHYYIRHRQRACQVRSRPIHTSFGGGARGLSIMMFGAGTGMAPFRGFIQERAIQIAAGRKLAPALMFMGCRSSVRDRLYAEQIVEWVKAGAVDVRHAFSQEPEESRGCKRIQDRLLEEKEDVLRT